MKPLRRLARLHYRAMLAFVLVVLGVQALVPAGFMLSAGGERFLTVTICADASDTPRQMRIAIPNTDDTGGPSSKADEKRQPCAFSGLGHAALGGADPVLLAAALAFILLVAFAPLHALPLRGMAFLRPPLRGPPLLAD